MHGGKRVRLRAFIGMVSCGNDALDRGAAHRIAAFSNTGRSWVNGLMASRQITAVLVQPRQIELREAPIPEPGPGEILVRIEAATTCGTDLKMFRRGHPLFPFPITFGHEFSGTVAAIGAGVRAYREGDAVMAVHSAPCGECRYCRRGLFNHCVTLIETMALGAYAEYVKLPARHVAQNVYRKPPELSFAEASLLEPLACCVYGLRMLRLDGPPGTDPNSLGDESPVVVLYGAGPISLIFLRVLVGYFNARAVVVARRDAPRETARRLGATLAVSPEDAANAVRDLTGGFLADIAIDATGQPEVWERCVDLVDLGGQVLFFGGCPSQTSVTLDTHRLHYDQIAVYGAFHFDPAAVREAARLLTERRVDLRPLLTGTYPLTELPDVFSRLDSGHGGIKDVIRPPIVE